MDTCTEQLLKSILSTLRDKDAIVLSPEQGGVYTAKRNGIAIVIGQSLGVNPTLVFNGQTAAGPLEQGKVPLTNNELIYQIPVGVGDTFAITGLSINRVINTATGAVASVANPSASGSASMARMASNGLTTSIGAAMTSTYFYQIPVNDQIFVLIVGVDGGAANLTGFTVSDGNGDTFVLVPGSGSSGSGGAIQVYVATSKSAVSSKITVTPQGTSLGSVTAFAEVFQGHNLAQQYTTIATNGTPATDNNTIDIGLLPTGGFIFMLGYATCDATGGTTQFFATGTISGFHNPTQFFSSQISSCFVATTPDNNSVIIAFGTGFSGGFYKVIALGVS